MDGKLQASIIFTTLKRGARNMFLNYKINIVNIDNQTIATINCDTVKALTLADIASVLKDYIDNTTDYIDIKISQR